MVRKIISELGLLIPVYSFGNDKVVRYLSDEELSAEFVEEYLHGQIHRVEVNDKGAISYSTLRCKHTRYCLNPGEDLHGNCSIFTPTPTDLLYYADDIDCLAACYAVGVCRRESGSKNKFVNDTSGEIWEKSDSQNYDRYVTLIVGDKHYTYYFKRIWE